MANVQNLKPFKKGKDERRNENGRPKGPALATRFKTFLEGKDTYAVDGEAVAMTREEIMMFRLFEIAKSGDQTKDGEKQGVSVAAIKEIYDRVYGKPTQAIEHSGDDGGPIEFEQTVINIAFRPPSDLPNESGGNKKEKGTRRQG